MATNSPGLCHRRLVKFVEWIRTPDDKEETIIAQSEEIRARIKGKAKEDDLVIRSTPNSGSFAKRTGLRRHMLGASEVEGQDVDLPFVVSPKTTDGDIIEDLLSRFERYAKASYPDTKRNPTKSSIRLSFVGTKLNYDLVPMLAVPGKDDEQVLLRSNGERRATSVQKHIEFIRSRTRKSAEDSRNTRFNDCVRLVKWWREIVQSTSSVLEDIPTILIDLLCARSFDELGVDESYLTTMSRWFGRMANLARRRESIGFTDYTPNPLSKVSAAKWAVIDPVNSENNVVPTDWGNLHLDELAQRFEKARDLWGRIKADELAGEDAKSMQGLVSIFGSAIKQHGEV